MRQFIKVATTDELADQQAKLVEVEGQKIDGGFYALSDTCTQRRGPFSEGTVEGAEVTCPWHGSDVRHQDRSGPGTARWEAVKSYPVRVTGPDIEIEL